MAARIIRKITKWFFISLNIFICIIFLLACLSPYVNPQEWSLIGFLSLSVPYVAVLLIFSVIFWLIAKPVVSLIPILTLLIGWKQLSVICAWKPLHTFNSEIKTDSILRIVTWNVRGMYGLSNSGYTQQRNRNEIAALVNNLKPDIVCLQEFNNVTYGGNKDGNNIELFKVACPYYYFSRDYTNKSKSYTSGCIVFSKYPILDSGKIKYPGANAESLIYVDILKGEDRIRIFTTHLQSFQFSGSDYANMERIRDADAATLKASENIFSKMRNVFLQHGLQANMVRNAADKTPYPSVICGDFNDVPNSYTYFRIRGKRQDAFLATSFGVGRSYNALAPTLRIDYILPDDNFKIHQFDMVDEGLSDHHMLVTDVSLKK
jgi:endonuclease/exonuclease/phosphatase family metal-dependent hydrolase